MSVIDEEKKLLDRKVDDIKKYITLHMRNNAVSNRRLNELEVLIDALRQKTHEALVNVKKGDKVV